MFGGLQWPTLRAWPLHSWIRLPKQQHNYPGSRVTIKRRSICFVIINDVLSLQ